MDAALLDALDLHESAPCRLCKPLFGERDVMIAPVLGRMNDADRSRLDAACWICPRCAAVRKMPLRAAKETQP